MIEDKIHNKKTSIQYKGETPLCETEFRIEEKKFKHNNFIDKDIIDYKKNNFNCEYTEYKTQSNKILLSFDKIPGFFVMPTYFDIQEQKYLLNQALNLYTKSDLYINNVVSLDPTKKTDGYTKNIRWMQLGEEYDWKTVSYSKNNKQNNFPEDLKNIICEITNQVSSLDINNNKVKYDNYNPEIAFVNYYPVGTGMFAHQDKSEHTFDRPLVSISLGCSCIFLIGDETRDTKPYAFKLHSGDVVLMTGKSRLAFHSVPKIYDDLPENLSDIEHMDKLRININVRQVYE
jgi:alkylated DNA repair protein alkB family protein 1